MKKHMIIMTACLMSGVASGATSGFTTECDAYVQYMACVSEFVLGDLSKFSCDQILAADDAFKNYDKTAAENKCKPGFSSYPFTSSASEDAVIYVQTYLFDKCVVNGWDLFNTNLSIAIDILRNASFIFGLCECNKPGYYILPRGVTPGRWAIDAECRPCPGGGTTDASSWPIELQSCYIPAGGTFTDETGSGTYSDNCYANYEDEQDVMDAHK